MRPPHLTVEYVDAEFQEGRVQRNRRGSTVAAGWGASTVRHAVETYEYTSDQRTTHDAASWVDERPHRLVLLPQQNAIFIHFFTVCTDRSWLGLRTSETWKHGVEHQLSLDNQSGQGTGLFPNASKREASVSG
jgi:hypothetical protein